MNDFNEIREKVSENIEAIFLSYQTENGIKDGGLPPELYLDIDERIEHLTEAIIRGLDWQYAHNR